MTYLNVADYEREAERVLDSGAFGYFAGGAGDERTLRDNVEAFSRWQLRPRVLVDVGEVTTSATVLGREMSMPLLVAPTAFQRLAHPEGEAATARAAADAGTVMCQSTLSSLTPGGLAAAAPGATLWFQLYWSSDRGFTAELLAAVVEAGFEAVVLTVDLPAVGRRERDLRAAFALPEDLALPNIPGSLQRPRLPRRAERDRRPDADLARSRMAARAVSASAPAERDSDVGGRAARGRARGRWRDRLEPRRPPAGRRCGVARRIAGGRTRWSDGRLEVLLDGGVQRGTDVLKALALGARAVLAGRAVVWGLAVGGEQGAREVLELLRAEIALGLTHLGCRSPAEVTRAHVKAK